MIRSLLYLTLVASMLLTTSGCALFRKKAKKRVPVLHPVLIGTVSLVNESGGFALIDNGALPAPPAKATLKSYSEATESAELVATDVRKRPFVIADIRSGMPRKGDRVFFIPTGMKTQGAKPAGSPEPRPPESPTSRSGAPVEVLPPPQLAPAASAEDQ